MLVESKFACQPRFDFRDHRAIVTGGSRGIGRAIADALSDAGAQVSIFDVNEPDQLERFQHRFVRIDIADGNAVRAAMAELPKAPTLLVNNAGITRDRSIAKMSDTDWSAVLNVNLTGTFNMIRAVAPRMVEQGFGRIVNITSINGLRGKFGQANYSAAKAGLIGLTKTAAKELGAKGVNAVAPGMVMTDMARVLPEEILLTALDEAVLTELADPQDISNAVLFLFRTLPVVSPAKYYASTQGNISERAKAAVCRPPDIERSALSAINRL